MAFRLEKSRIAQGMRAARDFIHRFKLMPEKAERLNGLQQKALDNLLLRAAMEGRNGDMERLLEKGASINAKGEKGRTLLMIAASHSRNEAARLLINKNGKKEYVNAADADGMTALIHAAICGNTNICISLLLKGASIMARDNNGMTALMHATENDRRATAEILRSAEAMGKREMRQYLSSLVYDTSY
jgi:ankyrin repeat protein